MTNERILIVEDEEVAVIHIQNVLEKIGYTVAATVTSGEMAIQQAAEIHPDLVLMDIHLAGEMNGIEAAGQIRVRSDIPVIYLTSYADDRFLQQAQITEPYGYLIKPVQEGELHATIKMALYKHEAEIKLKETNKRLKQEIVERRRAEEELEQHRHHLEKLVKERTTELSKANTELTRASRHKDEFLANMSHELRTPLNAILGYAQILKSDENLTERQREGLDTIKSSGEHLLTMINEILDLSKIGAGSMELQESEFHLPGFLKYIAKITRMRAEQKGLSFIYEPDPNLPAGVRADEKRLREVLLNILGNSVKFTEKGSVTLRIVNLHPPTPLKGGIPSCNNDQKSPLEGGRGVSSLLQFKIEDTGIGIAPEQLEEIFLPFQQANKPRNSVEGTGLGLAISHKLVAMMGAELRVQSTVGKGSTFWFEVLLPEVSGIVSKEQSYGRRITGYKGKQRTVIVADDDEHNRAVLIGMLLPLGFKAVEAANGQVCIEKAIKYHPDLILLDLRMPILDGFGATQQIRKAEEQKLRRAEAEKGRSEEEQKQGQSKIQARQSTINNQQSTIRTIIIAVSASVFEETRKRALKAGFNDFIIKPFQQEKLLDLLQTYLNIEWIYEDAEEIVRRDVQFDQEHIPLIPLPLATAGNLRQLAKLGITKNLLLELDKIEHQDPQYTPFVDALRQLAKNYQFDRIIELLETKKQKE